MASIFIGSFPLYPQGAVITTGLFPIQFPFIEISAPLGIVLIVIVGVGGATYGPVAQPLTIAAIKPRNMRDNKGLNATFQVSSILIGYAIFDFIPIQISQL